MDIIPPEELGELAPNRFLLFFLLSHLRRYHLHPVAALLTLQIYHALMDGACAEQSIRMAAMENATNNAGKF
jgi:hypothetical protein